MGGVGGCGEEGCGEGWEVAENGVRLDGWMVCVGVGEGGGGVERLWRGCHVFGGGGGGSGRECVGCALCVGGGGVLCTCVGE